MTHQARLFTLSTFHFFYLERIPGKKPARIISETRAAIYCRIKLILSEKLVDTLESSQTKLNENCLNLLRHLLYVMEQRGCVSV